MDATERRLPAPPAYRRPLVLVSAAVTIVILGALLVWMTRSLQSSKLDRWQPERTGNAEVLEKTRRGEDFILQIRLEVPAASPADAALIPADADGRNAMLPARTIDAAVHVDREQWDAAEPGMRVRALYHINVRRSDVFVPTVYLDAMEADGAQK
jgi:hypothetical protein